MLFDHFLMYLAVPVINFVVLLMIFRKLWHVDRELEDRTARFENIEKALADIKRLEEKKTHDDA